MGGRKETEAPKCKGKVGGGSGWGSRVVRVEGWASVINVKIKNRFLPHLYLLGKLTIPTAIKTFSFKRWFFFSFPEYCGGFVQFSTGFAFVSIFPPKYLTCRNILLRQPLQVKDTRSKASRAGEACVYFLLWLETASEKGTGGNGKRSLLLCVDHQVFLVVHGVRSSLGTVSAKPATHGAMKLPVRIHQVLRALLCPFRSSAWHFPVMVALANSLTGSRWLQQGTQLHYVCSNEGLSLRLTGGPRRAI